MVVHGALGYERLPGSVLAQIKRSSDRFRDRCISIHKLLYPQCV